MLFDHLPPITPDLRITSARGRNARTTGARAASSIAAANSAARSRRKRARWSWTAPRLWSAAPKRKGQRDGVLGQSALMVLRALLCHFLDTKSGRCDPSYKQIQKQTGFCVQTIAVALKRLERAGILDITRRIARKGAQIWNELTKKTTLNRRTGT